MKPLLILCILLSPLCLVAQNAGAAGDSVHDKDQIPKLKDFRVDVDNDGRFKTLAGTMKQMRTLTVSDLPSSNDPPFEIESTVKCLTFEALAVENEERGGALARMVPTEFLAAVPAAASLCFARNTISLSGNMHDWVAADIGAMVDAQEELNRRQYNELVERYNVLVEKHNALLTMTRSLASQLAATQIDLTRQQRINRALTIYEFMPKYTPPQTVNMNIQVTDCTKLPALCIH
jgi:hypothetical protein